MTTIAVYADWANLHSPRRLGFLHARRSGPREVFDFEYDHDALSDPQLCAITLDPGLLPFEGPQFPSPGRDIFGVFADSSPDRWGRMLMKRRLEREKRAGVLPSSTRLFESDFLLGVHEVIESAPCVSSWTTRVHFSTTSTTSPRLRLFSYASWKPSAEPLKVT